MIDFTRQELLDIILELQQRVRKLEDWKADVQVRSQKQIDDWVNSLQKAGI